MGVAGVAARVAGDRAQLVDHVGASCILHQRPDAVQRRGAKVVRVGGDDVAGAVADRAADALDARIDGFAIFCFRRNFFKIIAPRACALELPLGAGPLVEELAHVRDQVADHGQVFQRAYLQLVVARDVVDVRSASPAWHAVDRHRA